MFDRQIRRQLEDRAATLRNWERSVPVRALAFHRLRRQLLADIERHLERRLLGIDTQALTDCLERYRELAAMTPELTDLAARARDLENALEALEAKVQDGPTRLGPQGNRWRRDLARWPAGCEQALDLKAARRSLDQIESELHDHGELLHWLERGEQVLRTLGSSAETAPLEAALPGFRKALEGTGEQPSAVARLRELCPPLEARIRRPPPAELTRLGPLLLAVRDWDRELNPVPGSDPRVLDLSRRQRALQDDWRRFDDGEFRVLESEARRLLDELTGRAETIRAARMGDLEELLADLEHAAGPQTVVRDALADLRGRVVERFLDHAEWLEDLAQAEARCQALASHGMPILEQRLATRCADLAARLGTLDDRPLPLELRERSQALAAELGAIIAMSVDGDPLRALRRGNECQRGMESLEAAARNLGEELAAVRERLGAQNASLQAASRATGIACPDLAAAIATLDDSTDRATLAEIRRPGQQLAERLSRIEQDFLAAGRQLLADRRAAVGELRDALAAAGAGMTEAESGEPVELLDQTAVLTRLAEVEAEQGRLLVAIDAALRTASGTAAELTNRLTSTECPALDSARRAEAEDLARQLTASPGSGSPAERLRRLAAALAAATTFLSRFGADREALRQRLERSRVRLATLHREGLQEFCPEPLIHRAADLVYGIPARPRLADETQVRQAERLLDQIEGQSHRLAAARVGAWLRALHQAPPDPADPARVARVSEQIRALAPEQPVPAALREALAQAAGLANAESRHG